VTRQRLVRVSAAFAAAVALATATLPAAAQDRVLRVSFPIAETGFDPQASGDIYSNYVNRAIFDSLYRYDYLARPYRIEPSVAAAMPVWAGTMRAMTASVCARASSLPRVATRKRVRITSCQRSRATCRVSRKPRVRCMRTTSRDWPS